MQTAEFIKPIQEQVLRHYGLELTRNKHRDCFICQGKKKLRITEWQGDIRGICTCGSYSLLDLLIEYTGQDFASLATDIDKAFGNEREITEYKAPDTSRRDAAISLFRGAQPIRGSDAQSYLNARGIFELPTGGVKFGTVHDHKEKRDITAMIALASTEFSEPRQMHVTYIENGEKANVETVRKMHSLAAKDLSDQEINEPIAIKLFEAGAVLGVAEGIESALSAKQLYRMPVWSTINANYLEKFRAPTGVHTLYIFADNDNSLTGHASAFKCARGNLLCSNDVREVIIRWPEEQGKDFNDVLVEGVDVVEMRSQR